MTRAVALTDIDAGCKQCTRRPLPLLTWQSSDSSLALSKNALPPSSNIFTQQRMQYIETELLKYKMHNITQHGLPGSSVPCSIHLTFSQSVYVSCQGVKVHELIVF